MEQSVFCEMDKINDLLSQYSGKEFTEKYTESYKNTVANRLSSAIRASGAGAGAGAIAGMILGGPIGGILGGTISAAASAAASAVAQPEYHEKTHVRIRKTASYEIEPDAFHAVGHSLAQLMESWRKSLSYQDRLTAYFSVFNGLALYCVPQSVCIGLIQEVADPDEKQILERFVNFVYDQLKAADDSTTVILNHFSSFDGADCPHVVSLYLFVEAMSRYLPNETDAEAFALAERCYRRLPPGYQDFILGKRSSPTANPAVHQFLLPQFEKSLSPVGRSVRKDDTLDYISRQVFLHLRVPVYYSEGPHMGLTAKMLALLESKKFAYQAAESVYSIQSILRDFAHTYGNMKASQLTTISEKLFMASQKYDDPELRKLAQLVVLEAKIKHDLTTGIQLMHLRCREDVVQLSDRLHNSIADDSDEAAESESVETIEDILDSSIRLCLYRIFYDATDRKAEIARKKMRLIASNWSNLAHDFEEKVLVGGEQCVHWLQELSTPFSFEIDMVAGWKSLKWFKGSFASVLLEDLLAEVIFNAFKYSDYSKPIIIDFWQSDEFLGIRLTNSLPENPSRHTQGSGLLSRNETMTLLNGPGTTSVEAGGDEEGHFITNIRLRRSLFSH